MTKSITSRAAQKDLSALLKQVSDNHETIIIKRQQGDDVAMLPATELSGLLETIHLLRSPKNAIRLLTAIKRAQASTKTHTDLK